jgi:hypothetical protein
MFFLRKIFFSSLPYVIVTQATDCVVSLLKLEPMSPILPGIVSFSNDTFITAATGSVGLLY